MTSPENPVPAPEPSESPSDDIRGLHRLVNEPVIPGQHDDYGTYFEVPGPETRELEGDAADSVGEPVQQGLFDISSVVEEPVEEEQLDANTEKVADNGYDPQGRSPGAQRAQRNIDSDFWRNQGR